MGSKREKRAGSLFPSQAVLEVAGWGARELGVSKSASKAGALRSRSEFCEEKVFKRPVILQRGKPMRCHFPGFDGGWVEKYDRI